jgi:hypothetical protein
MIAISILIVLGLIVFLMFGQKPKQNPFFKFKNKSEAEPNENIDYESTEDIEIDEDGREFKWVKVTRKVPRKTFLSGQLNSKYWGEIDETNYYDSSANKFFNFRIYEAIVHTTVTASCSCLKEGKTLCIGIHKEFEGPFEILNSSPITLNNLPDNLICDIKVDENNTKYYSILLHDIQLRNIKINRMLHQNEGDEVFGTLNADITGYILDFLTEITMEKEYLVSPIELAPLTIKVSPTLEKTYITTGNLEFKDGYYRKEYYFNDYETTYWSNWIRTNSNRNTTASGCASTSIGIIGIIFSIFFVLISLPSILWLLPIIGLYFLLSQFSITTWNWLALVIGLIILLTFLSSIIYSIADNTSPKGPTSVLLKINPQASVKSQGKPTLRQSSNYVDNPDTLITYTKVWKDYKNTTYTGRYWLMSSDLSTSSRFRNNLNISVDDETTYDEMLYRIKEHDKDLLQGVYQMFDSLKDSRHLNSISTAEMIVSFVQDFPFVLLLSNDCDPGLYENSFVEEFLTENPSLCRGFEKYGIYAPVEYLYFQEGDCDTRTTLLYTLLSHYNYDVCILSSELYSHSILGINLPFSGVTYKQGNERFVIWETTFPETGPGLLYPDIADMNNWRISLKSSEYE